MKYYCIAAGIDYSKKYTLPYTSIKEGEEALRGLIEFDERTWIKAKKSKRGFEK